MQQHPGTSTSHLIPMSESDCGCSTCRDYSRAALHHLFHEGTTLAGQLLTIHNIAYMMRLVRGMRRAIQDQNYPTFVKDFLRVQFPPPAATVPGWVVEALQAVNISLEGSDLVLEKKNDARKVMPEDQPEPAQKRQKKSAPSDEN